MLMSQANGEARLTGLLRLPEMLEKRVVQEGG